MNLVILSGIIFAIKSSIFIPFPLLSLAALKIFPAHSSLFSINDFTRTILMRELAGTPYKSAFFEWLS